MELETRVTALEKEVADLKRQLEDQPKLEPIVPDFVQSIVLSAIQSNRYSLREALRKQLELHSVQEVAKSE